MTNGYEGPKTKGKDVEGWFGKGEKLERHYEVSYLDVLDLMGGRDQFEGNYPDILPGNKIVHAALKYGQNDADFLKKIQRQPYSQPGVSERGANKLITYYIGQGENVELSKARDITIETIKCNQQEVRNIVDYFDLMENITGFEIERVGRIEEAAIDIHLQAKLNVGKEDDGQIHTGISLPGSSANEQYWRTILWTRASEENWHKMGFGGLTDEELQAISSQTILHELGHAFGLSHPGQSRSGANPYYNWLDTLMSYVVPVLEDEIDPREQLDVLPIPTEYNEVEVDVLRDNFTEFLANDPGKYPIIIEDRGEGFEWFYEGLDPYTRHSALTKLTENTSRYDYSYHGINGNEKIVGSEIDDIIYAHGGRDRLYLTPGFDLILTGTGKDTLYITTESVLATDSYSLVEDFDPKKDQLEFEDVDMFIDSLSIVEIGNCAAIVFDSAPVAIFNGVTLDEFMQADIPSSFLA